MAVNDLETGELLFSDVVDYEKHRTTHEDENDRTGVEEARMDKLSQESSALQEVLRVFVAEDVKNPALHNIIRLIKQICEEMEFPMKTARLYYRERGNRYRNALVRRAQVVYGGRKGTKSEKTM